MSKLGEFAYEIACEQVDSFDKSLKKINDFAQSRTGHITISCVPSVAIHIIPEVLPRFSHSRPGVEIELFDMDGGSVFNAVLTGKTQIGIAGKPEPHWALDFEPLFEDPFVVIYNPDYFDITPNSDVSWAELAQYPMIKNGAASVIKSDGFAELAEAATLTVRNINSLMALLNSGMGLTILPSLTALDLPAGLATAHLSEPINNRIVGMITPVNKSQDPLMRSFRLSVQETMPSIASRLTAIDLIRKNKLPTR